MAILTFAIGLLIFIVSRESLHSDKLYADETASWRAQCYGQDIFNLWVVLPCLISCVFLWLFRPGIAELAWPGTLLYILYSFVIYAFDVHFNRYFILYCLILGSNAYALLYFVYTGADKGKRPKPWIIILTAVYFLVTGLLFSVAWLSGIIKAYLTCSVPKDVVDAGLPTNPVQVLDLAFILPLFFTGGIFLLHKRHPGFRLAPWLLVFSVLMYATISFLTFIAAGISATVVVFLLL
ncbi:MAG: hypothetical protein ACXVP0_12810, partial [Bacteroidia bacterium]